MVAPNLIIVEPETPQWWKRAAERFERLFVAANRPLQLTGYTTANLPDPAQWKACLLYDLTDDMVKVSDGATWNAL